MTGSQVRPPLVQAGVAGPSIAENPKFPLRFVFDQYWFKEKGKGYLFFTKAFFFFLFLLELFSFFGFLLFLFLPFPFLVSLKGFLVFPFLLLPQRSLPFPSFPIVALINTFFSKKGQITDFSLLASRKAPPNRWID